MKKFAGKYSLVINGRKLVLWEQHLGLIGKDRTTVKNNRGVLVPLAPETCIFLAIDNGDGTFLLQAHNGEAVSFGRGNGFGFATTYPTQMPYYLAPTGIARFDLAAFRLARSNSGKARLTFRIDGGFIKVAHDLIWNHTRGSRELDDTGAASPGTNLDSTPNLGGADALWEIIQHADGVDEMQAAKKVSHFNFARNGKAIIDVSGEDLSGIDFGRADFSEAVLTGTKLNGSTHNQSRFVKAALDRATLDGSTLTEVDFSGASMDATSLKSLVGTGCNFSNCDLRKVVIAAPLALLSPKTSPMRFSKAKMKYALIGNNWSDKIMNYAVIEAIPKITGLNAQGADLTGVVLTRLEAPQANFSNAILHAAKMSSAILPFAKFNSASLNATADLAATDLTSARLQGAKFDDANASNVSFAGARLEQATFERASIRFANFASAYLKKVSFAAVEQKLMTGVNFTRAFLVGCNFTDADLSTYDKIGVTLAQAYLHGADFTNARLAGALLTDAGISEDEGELQVTLDGEGTTVNYGATIIEPELCTTGDTTCPSGEGGPCEGEKMHTLKPFPTSWPWPRSGKRRPKKKPRR